MPDDHEADIEVASAESRASWARLTRKIYQGARRGLRAPDDPLVCKKCGSAMKILAVITDPDEVKSILRHLMKTGESPPGLDPASFQLN